MDKAILQNEILLLIDLQKGFYNENTKSCFNKVLELLVNHSFSKVIATKFCNFFEENMFERYLNYEKMRDKTEIDIPEWLAKSASVVVLKDRYNCVSPHFLKQLRLLNGGIMPQRVFIAGVDTEACVLMTANGLFEAGIQPIILASHCASSQGKEMHDNALEIAKTCSYFNLSIMT